MLLGMTGSGKSYLFKQWLRLLQQRGRATFVVDVGDEYSAAGNDRGKTLALGPLRQRYTVPEFLMRAARSPEFVLRKDASVAIVPTVTDAGEALAEHIRPVLRLLYARGHCIIGFDELQKYGQHLAPELYRAAGELGKDGITPFFVSQYPGGVPEIVRKQVSSCIAAEMGKSSDRRMLASDFGDAFAQALADAPERVFHIGFSRARFARIPTR
ncbi:type IV secretory system conjugative DNA transfer family protein [Myxococcus stipitatus]|uniref:DUF87 domain-containing protein n=1 Tax=Myxococcus stipitatus TaxID=83455 RepID=UPI001F1A2C55|nr:DUF87 domain-containing protein [Myxococcus stipitatus]MCE9674081.1 type IV secretory system conjugative DNA transfer family protein [Myxococcus stipitatus]